jgi:hypothetical protein
MDLLVAANAGRWRDYAADPYRARLEACGGRPWDLVVVGGSPAMCGFDPAVLEGARWKGRPLDRVYNLGLPLATASEVSLAVEHGLRRPPPRLLVYGVSATDFNEDRVEPQGPRRLMDVGDVVRWSRGRPEAAGWCLRHFAEEHAERAWGLYYQRNAIRLWAAEQADRLWPGACPAAAAEARATREAAAGLRASHGFQAATDNDRLDRLKAAGRIDASSLPFMEHYRLDDAGYLRCLGRLLATAGRRGVTVVLIDMPVPADLDVRLYPREYAAYRAALAAAARGRGVRLLSATRQAVGLTDADFSDLVHLNREGAARLSAWLRRELEEAG